MPRFQVSGRGTPLVTIEAGNWLTALGLGLDRLGVVSALDRLACEVLPNGTVIARDARTGQGFIVTPAADAAPDPDDEPTELTEQESAELALALDGVEDYTEEEDTAELNKRFIGTLLATVGEAATELQAWERALEVVQELVPSEAGAALRREASGALRFVAASGPKARDVMGVTLPPETGIVGFCVTREVGLVVTRPQRDPRFFAEMDRITNYRTDNLMCVPVRDLHTAGRPWGCLELLNAQGGFARNQLELAEEVAGALSRRLGPR